MEFTERRLLNRFNKIKTEQHFYFNAKLVSIINKNPDTKSSARHTQGLVHKNIVDEFATLMQKL